MKGIMAGIQVKLNQVVTFNRTPQAMGRPVTIFTSLMSTTILQVILSYVSEFDSCMHSGSQVDIV